MNEPFESPVFGMTRLPSESEITELRRLVSEVPVAMFQELNRKLNARGLCISITTLEEKEPE